jgi:uncharacterized protein YbaP (TraB family)
MRTSRLPLLLVLSIIWSIISPLSSYSRTDSLPKTLLWRISGNGFAAPSYLYATMHLRDKSLFRFTDSVYAAIRKSATFALELHPDTLASVAFSQVTRAANGERPASRTGKSSGKGKPYRSKVLDDMPTIVDLYLFGVAADLGRRIEGLESLAGQAAYIDKTGTEADDFFDDSRYAEQMVDRMKTVYTQGDLWQIHTMVQAMDDPAEQKRMLERNTVMAGRIAELGQRAPLFAAVGAAHFAGDFGLISLLRMRGFTVEPILDGKPLPAGSYAFSRPPSWNDYDDPDGYFRVSMPGTVRSFPVERMGYQFHGTVDLTQLRFYFAGSMPMIGVTAAQRDSLLQVFGRVFAAGQDYGSVRETALRDSNGVYGRDLVFRDNENRFNFRFRLILQDQRAYFLGIAAPQEKMLDDMVSARFLESFKALPVQLDAAGYRWSDGLAELKLPRKPETALLPASDSTMRAVQWSTADPQAEVFYILVRTDANPGYVISDEDAYFSNVASGFGENTGMTVYGLRDTLVQGFPARRFFARPAREAVFVEALLVKQGSRVYAMVVTAGDSAASETQRIAFFRSFRLSKPAYGPWMSRYSPEGRFTAWSPGAWQVDEAESTAGARTTFFSYDSLTSTTYQLMSDTLSAYTWSASDTALLSMSASDYIFDRHPLLDRRFIRMEGLPALEILTRCEDSTMVKKLRMVIKGRNRYVLFAFMPVAWIDDPYVVRFFETFRLPTDQDSLMVYRNKPSVLLDDIIGADPEKQEKAFESLEHAPFEPGDFPMLLDYGLKVPVPPADETDPGEVILQRAATLVTANPAYQDIFIGELSRRYRSGSEDVRNRAFALLGMLVRMQTSASHEALLSLLDTYRPERGDPFSMFYHLRDSIALARILYPKMLEWSADSIIGMPAFSLHPFMMEGKQIGQQMVESERAAVDAGLERLLKHYASGRDADNWWYGFRAIEFISQLAGPHWDQWLNRFLSLSRPELKEAAALKMAARKLPVPAATWDTLASLDNLRADLYRQLESMGQLDRFPSKYKTQGHFAVASLWENTDDEEPSLIAFIGTEDMEFRGKKSRFYLYRVVFEADGERSEYLGVSGPYKPKDRKLLPADAVTGIHWSESYTRGLERKQLRNFLDQFNEPPAGLEKIDR